MLFREACKGREFTGAGVSDQDIDFSFRLHGLVESMKVRQFGDVSPNACNLAADRLDGFVEFRLAASRYEDISALVREPLRCSETYSRGAPGNHGHFCLQLAHSCHSFC